MRGFATALLCLFACTASVVLDPPVTCSGVTLQNVNGECDLVPKGACSDMHFYSVNCGDDSTCTCVIDANPGTPILASDKTSGFCATLTTAMMQDISNKCPDPNKSGVYLNIVTTP